MQDVKKGQELETYIIVVGKNAKDLQDKVISSIRSGYMPIGGVVADSYIWAQAMVWRLGLDD
jgi:hypothetical protein